MKDSTVEWIGEIPESWKVAKIKKFFNVFSGEYIERDSYIDNGLYPVIGSNGEIGRTNEINNNSKVVTTGRVGTIGKVHLVEKAWITDNTLILKPIGNMLSSYLYYLIPSLDFNLISSGTAQPLITSTKLKEQKVPFTNIEKQQKIVNLLEIKVSQMDLIIEHTKQSIEELKKYKQSIITEAVTKGLNPNVKMKDSGIEWIGNVPEAWDVIKTNRLFSIKKEIANNTGYDILSVTQRGLKVKDITQNEGQMAADYSKYQIVQPDDFVMNHMDLLTGWVDLAVQEGVTSPDYRVFYNKQNELVFNRFYLYVFQICYLNKIFYGLGQGVSNFGRWRLQTDKFLNFYLPLPTFEEQIEIVNYLDSQTNKVDSLIQDKVKAIEELEKYKKSLIYEYVTGKKEV